MACIRIFFFLFFFCFFSPDSYNVDSGQVSVSGISSGAAMATQFHVAHSRDVMGVGTIAGGKMKASCAIVD